MEQLEAVRRALEPFDKIIEVVSKRLPTPCDEDGTPIVALHGHVLEQRSEQSQFTWHQATLPPTHRPDAIIACC